MKVNRDDSEVIGGYLCEWSIYPVCKEWQIEFRVILGDDGQDTIYITQDKHNLSECQEWIESVTDDEVSHFVLENKPEYY